MRTTRCQRQALWRIALGEGPQARLVTLRRLQQAGYIKINPIGEGELLPRGAYRLALDCGAQPPVQAWHKAMEYSKTALRDYCRFGKVGHYAGALQLAHNLERFWKKETVEVLRALRAEALSLND
jgi:hypothetical protein